MIMQYTDSTQEVRTLLNKTLFNKTPNEIQGWMHHCYDGDNMFCWKQNNQIVSILQLEHIAISFQEQKMAACQIVLAATHPDYRQRKYFTKLLEAALDTARYNELFTIVYTDFPRLFLSHGFVPISNTVSYWINLVDFDLGEAQHVVPYRSSIDIYPTYLKFIHTFDGSKIYTREQFLKRITYAQSIRKKIVVMMNEQEQPQGFAIISNMEAQANIDCIVYMNSNVVLDALAYLAKRCRAVSITISENERLDKITHLDYPREKGTTLVRVNNAKLLSRYLHRTVKSAKEAYRLLERPDWNHF